MAADLPGGPAYIQYIYSKAKGKSAIAIHTMKRYGFCDAYCRGHTGSRPERAAGSLLASLSGKVPGTSL